MTISVQEVALQLEERNLLKRERHDHSDTIIGHVRDLLERELPPDLVEFYRERIASIGEFSSMTPHWNERVGSRHMGCGLIIKRIWPN